MNLIPFDIEKAKKGEKVITRTGYSVRVIACDINARKPIVAVLILGDGSEEVNTYNSNGTLDSSFRSGVDLFHPEPEMYVNVYKNGECSGHTYSDVTSARMGSRADMCIGVYKLVKVE